MKVLNCEICDAETRASEVRARLVGWVVFDGPVPMAACRDCVRFAVGKIISERASQREDRCVVCDGDGS